MNSAAYVYPWCDECIHAHTRPRRSASNKAIFICGCTCAEEIADASVNAWRRRAAA